MILVKGLVRKNDGAGRANLKVSFTAMRGDRPLLANQLELNIPYGGLLEGEFRARALCEMERAMIRSTEDVTPGEVPTVSWAGALVDEILK